MLQCSPSTKGTSKSEVLWPRKSVPKASEVLWSGKEPLYGESSLLSANPPHPGVRGHARQRGKALLGHAGPVSLMWPQLLGHFCCPESVVGVDASPIGKHHHPPVPAAGPSLQLRGQCLGPPPPLIMSLLNTVQTSSVIQVHRLPQRHKPAGA